MKLFTFIKDNSFLVLGILSIAFLLVYGLILNIKGARGSWNHKITNKNKPYSQAGIESKGEKRTRAFLESYFSCKFPKARPDFLNNDVTGGRFNMELDCFNADLKLAVEYNGRQHYEYTPYFHSSKDAFYNQKYRDKLKKIYCTERGITLIEIPYTELKNLESWLEAQLMLRGFARAETSSAKLP